MDTDKHKLATAGIASSRAPLNRRTLWIAALPIAVLFGIGFYSFKHREPVVGGKRLSVWLDVIEHDPLHAEDAVRATQAIGTDALPWLLSELEDGSLRCRANELLSEQKLLEFRFRDSARRRDRAIVGFFALGPNGRSAIPFLLERIQSKRIAIAELYALAMTGDDVIPHLMANLSNGCRPDISWQTAFVIQQAVGLHSISGSNAQAFLPALRHLLKSADFSTRSYATDAVNVIEEFTTNNSPIR